MTSTTFDSASLDVASNLSGMTTDQAGAPFEVTRLIDVTRLAGAANPRLYLAACLDHTNRWLLEVKGRVDTADVTALAQLRVEVERARSYTAGQRLGVECVLTVSEIARRVDRALALAIRRCQDAGMIAVHGDNTRSRPRPTDLTQLPDSTLSPLYRTCDEVTDSQFEQALAEAKAESSLTRANVLAKLDAAAGAEVKTRGSGRPEHLRKTRRHDPNRIVNEITNGLEGYVMTLDLIDFDGLDPERVEAWSESLSASLRALTRLNRRVKELPR